MFSRNLTLARFDGIIAELDHFAAVEANEVIVMMLLSQFEDGFTTFKIMAGHDTGIIKLRPAFFNAVLLSVMRNLSCS